jgi:hypothetical protein
MKGRMGTACVVVAALMVAISSWTVAGAGDISASSPSAPLATLVVNNTYDETGECPEFCSLRQAILDAQAQAGSDTIIFEISKEDPGYDPASGTWTLVLEGPLPMLDGVGELTIDATTLGDGACAAYFFIDAAAANYGLEITNAHKTIRGLGVRNAVVHGFYIHGLDAQDNTVACSQAASNGEDGVRIGDSASGNTLGPGNLFSDNGGDGAEITNQAHHNTVTGSRIGTNEAGTAVWPNAHYGVRLVNGAADNEIGLLGENGGNLISGNTLGGVAISSDPQASQGNVVQGNRIGTNVDGSAALPNLEGVLVANVANNTVGPDNTISGNLRDGVRITGGGASGNVVQANQIGTDAMGMARVTNRRFGILLEVEAHDNTIGAPSPLDGNLISGNGYDGDYPAYGGVGLFGSHHNNLWNNVIGESILGHDLGNGLHGVWLGQSAHDNAIGQASPLRYPNMISWNKGAGIFVEGPGTVRNTIGRNSIRDNDAEGIENQDGGNGELAPPEFLNYQTADFGLVTLQGRTCPGCQVTIYSDDAGEGKWLEGQTAGHPDSGYFDWSSNPAGAVFTLVATDGNGNSSEFSAAPARLLLSVDDALPGVAVSKVRGDADGPAGETRVEIVATIVSDDPLLDTGFLVEVQIPGDQLGQPVRVLYRDDPADYPGQSIVWTNPSPGTYRVDPVDLLAVTGAGLLRSQRRVVFRFAIPHGAPLGTLLVTGRAAVPGRRIEPDSGMAIVRLVQRVEEIIVTNRAQLYEDYGDQADVTAFLGHLYSLAQGPPFNWSPPSAVYYVDAYAPALASWDNESVDYSSTSAANVHANMVDDLIEDWAEDSTTKWEPWCYPLWSPPCQSYPLDTPPFLLIAGDDNIVPFYRHNDPTDAEEERTCRPDGTFCAPTTVLDELRAHGYLFTENAYADLSYSPDNFPWHEGGVELFASRLIGSQASDMSTLMVSGQYGPHAENPARAIVASACKIEEGGSAGYLRDYGYDVRNDTESPSTIRNNDWRISDLESLMAQDYQALVHANHANELYWCAPPCDCGGKLKTASLSDSRLATPIAANRAVMSSAGCRAGLSPARAGATTMATALVHDGASALMASTAINNACTWPSGCVGSAEDLLQTFWELATNRPDEGLLSLGGALGWAKRTFDGHITVDDEEAKTGAEFVLYGLPWVAVPQRGTSTEGWLHSSFPLDPAPAGGRSAPSAVAPDTYVFNAPFDAWDYGVVHEDGFDRVVVAGMPQSRDFDGPVVPLAQATMHLPPDAVVTGIEVAFDNPVSLGALNIPRIRPGEPIPGGDPGGPEPVPGMGIYPPQPVVSRTVLMDGYQIVRLNASPLSYDTDTGQATLYRDLNIAAVYELSTTVALQRLEVHPGDLTPGQEFAAVAHINNASDVEVVLTSFLTMEDGQGQVVGAKEGPELVVPPGGTTPFELAWAAPEGEGVYSLFLELQLGGVRQALGRAALTVSGGRLVGLEVPGGVRPGEQARFALLYFNRRGGYFAGTARLDIYDGRGLHLATLEAPVEAPAWGEGVTELFWDTGWLPPAAYLAAATVTDPVHGTTYGVIQREFHLVHVTHLPLILRDFSP